MNVQESRIGRRVVVGLALSVAAAVSAAPAEYVWTGVQNAYWTNAANWTVGGAVATDVPGVRFTTKDWQTFTNLNATASFGTVEEGKPTTINLDGLFFVSNLVVKAGAPKYTFGTAGQYLGLAHEGGRFTVEKGAAAPAVAGVYGFLWYPGMKESKPDTYDTPDEARFVNESEGELVLSNFGNTSPNAPSSGIGGTWCRFIGLGGAGDIRIDSWSKKRTSVALNLYPEGAQRLLLVGTTADPKTDQLVRGIQVGGGRKATVVVVEKTLELGQGTEVTTGKKKMPVVRVRDAGTRLTFTGDGVVGLHGMNQKSKPETFGKGFVPAGANIDAGAELIFACKVDGFFGSNAVTQKSPQESFYFHRGAGTLSFTRTDNAFEGGIDLLSFDKNATLAFTAPGQMGPGTIRIGNAGRLLYTGTEALAFGKDLAITNKTVGVDYEPTASVDASATVEQGGAGALTVTSKVDVSGTGGTAVLTLANSTAVAATWAGVLKDAEDRSKLALAKTGSGAWTLTAKNTFTGGATVKEGTLVLAAGANLASPVTIKGGATFAPAKGADLTSPVTIEDGGTLFIAESQTLPFALAFSGTAKLLLAPGIDVVIPADSTTVAEGAKLVLCLGEGSRVKMSDGSEPTWLGFASSRGLFMPKTTDADGYFTLAETRWQGADSVSWTEPANWTAGVPTEACAGLVNAAGQTVEVLAGATATTVGTVELEAGTVSVKGTLPIAILEHHERFVVGAQGTLQIDGGTVTAAHALGAKDYALHLDGGTLALTGAATLDLRASKGLLGTGSVTVDTTVGAAIQVSKDENQDACFSTGDSEGTLEMTVGRQAFAPTNPGHIVFGDSQKGAFRLTVEDRGPGDASALLVNGTLCPYAFYVGRQAGVADVVLQSGRLGGLDLACRRGVIVAGVTGAGAVVTGRVTVAGGQVAVSASKLTDYWSGIGFGVSTQKTDPSAVRGELKLVDGLVQVSNKSPLGFGVGNATGVGLQTGGTVNVTRSAGAVVLGYGSGTGEYVLSNGTFATGRPLYVGGCQKTDVQEAYFEGVSRAGSRAATGRLFARGGTLAATNELGIVVGADGRGRLEIGPSGNVTAKALVLSNNVEGVLAFELGARKAGTLKVDRLVIASGAKLEIDARALAADSRGTIHLADCGAVEGSFAASDVTILSPIGQEKRFAHAMILTERNGKNGLWLMLQPRGLIMVIR
mgnify:CR=1 FL=1